MRKKKEENGGRRKKKEEEEEEEEEEEKKRRKITLEWFGVVDGRLELHEKGVPILIFSAGLADIIEEVFRQKLHRSFKNIKIVSNRMAFDDNGRLVSFKGDPSTLL
ncbi:hypothetical protein M5K25_019073 [Dendrobium thyrsiflorum]|uniref:5'-nucleotidase n=1 Tax=Dendrobium thyrsiflorum TaxID=117978 RepID=A0ABD0UE73_DENTH